MLAGVSVDYYIKLERGNLAGASSSVLNGLARALQLNDIERTYLFTLAGGAANVPSLAPQTAISASLQKTIDQMDRTGVYLRNSRMDVVGANHVAERIFPWMRRPDGRFENIARYIFLDLTSIHFFPLWNKAAADAVLILRMHSVNNPHDAQGKSLIEELQSKSSVFRLLWTANDLDRQQVFSKQFNHPNLGLLDLNFQILNLADEPSVAMLLYSAEGKSESYAKLFQSS